MRKENTKQDLPCPCHSGIALDHCCGLYLKEYKSTNVGQIKGAPSAEKLMRSRYTAYALQDYEYVVNTYTKAKAQHLSTDSIREDSQFTQWISLYIIRSTPSTLTSEVEFIAFYKVKSEFYCLHENSQFVKEDGLWKYSTGDILAKTGKIKPHRNNKCICGSGKKFKRCCGM